MQMGVPRATGEVCPTPESSPTELTRLEWLVEWLMLFAVA